MVRAIHVLEHPLADTRPEYYAQGTWPGRTTRAIRAVAPDVGLECCFLDPDPKETRFTRGDVDFRVFQSKLGPDGLHWSPEMVRYFEEAAREKVVFHVHGYPTRLFSAISRIARRAGAPIIAQDHGRPPLDVARAPLARKPRLIARYWLEGLALKPVDQFYYVSEEERVRLLQWVPADKLRYQTMGIDAARFRPGDRASSAAKLGLPTDKHVLLMVGNDFLRKGGDLAARALEHLPKDTVLAIIGNAPPPVREVIEGEAAKAGASDRVLLLGPHSELMPDAYRAADLFLLPSAIEGAPVAIMEALATNLPVAATAVAGVAQMLDGYGVIIRERTPAAIAAAVTEARARSWPPSRDYAAARFGWGPIAEATVADYRRVWKARYG